MYFAAVLQSFLPLRLIVFMFQSGRSQIPDNHECYVEVWADGVEIQLLCP